MKAALLFFAAFVLSAVAGAQWSPPPAPHFESIDLPAANARAIFLGTLKQLPTTERTWEGQKLTFTVKQVLKGKPGDTAEALVRSNDESLGLWISKPSELLVSINEDGKGSVIDLSSPDLAVLTSDLKLLRKRDDVVKAVRERIQAVNGAPAVPVFSRSLPNWKLAGTPLTKQFNQYRNYFVLDIPADARLEKSARAQIKLPDREARLDAIRALSLFVTPENLALIKSMLNDEIGWERHQFVDVDRLLVYRSNPVRNLASEQLRRLKSEPWTPSVEPTDRLQQVIAVELDKKPLNEEDFKVLSSYPNLSELYFTGRKLTPAWLEVAAQQKNLRSLFLEDTNVTDKDLPRLASLPRLSYLALTETGVTDAGLASLSKIKSLRRVDVGQKVTAAGIKAFQKLRPDVAVKPDPFAFLSFLKARRVYQPIDFAQNGTLYGQGDEGTSLRRRTFVLVVPAEQAGTMEVTLLQKLPPRGWQKGPSVPATWTRPSLMIGLPQDRRGDEIDLAVDQRSTQPVLDRNLVFGERLILVSYNVDPTR